MMVLLTLLVVIPIAVVVHVISMAAAGWLVGTPLERIQLFFGPLIKRVNLGDTVLEIHAIPFGGSVKFSDDFHQIVHPIKRIFIAGFGCFALLILAMVAFGAAEGFHKFVRGFSQIIYGAIAPRSYGSNLLLSFYEFVRVNGFLACLGLVASKMAAGNLLPLPVLNGGDIIMILVTWIRPMSPKLRERVQQFGFVIVLIIFICWFVAFIYSLLRLPANFEFGLTIPSFQLPHPTSLLPVLVVIAFLLVLPLRWYQNYWMGTDSFDRPFIMRGGINQLVYMTVVFIWTYGSIIGIWYFYGLWTALAALIVKMIIGRLSWKRYFDRQVAEYTEFYYRQMVKAKSGIPSEQMSAIDKLGLGLVPEDVNTWSDEQMMREAYRRAYDTVRTMRLHGRM